MKCFNCDKEFISRWRGDGGKEKHQKYCSNSCCREKQKLLRRTIKEKRNCIFCNKEFIPNRKDKTFCSKHCKKNSYYWRNREQILKNPRLKEYHQIYHIRNKYNKQYKKRNSINSVKYIYSSPKRKTMHLLRNRFRKVLNNYTLYGKIETSSQYGIIYKAIIKKLEKDLGRKLTWKDLKENHIHHKKELVTFDLEKPNEIIKAFSPENTILMPIEEHKKISKEFLINWRKHN